jgi:CBS-domain-containing membrane protein
VNKEDAFAKKRFLTARDMMETELYIAKEDDIVELAINMMDWKNIRSIPVENSKNQLVGLITAREILRYHTMNESKRPETVKDLMLKDFVTISPDASAGEVVNLLAKTRESCLLVVDGKLIAGLVSESDLVQVAHMTNIFNS